MENYSDHNRKTIAPEHELIKCAVGPNNVGADVLLFRAPVIRDGSGSYKRLPHQIQWEHVQIGDAIIALATHCGPAGQKIIDLLQFWNVVDQEDEVTFWVEINNIVGMAGDGEYVYNRIASMVGLPPTE